MSSQQTATFAPFAKPLYVMLKPTGPVCNLRCSYCYYLDKKQYYPNQKNFFMSEELLEKFIEQYLNAQTMPQVQFCWHGGEALMRGIDFYKKAIKLQKKHARGMQIENVLQTNGTLLTDEWCRFFKENNFLIGISIDGPEHCNKYRKGHGDRPSFDSIMTGINMLRRHGVEFNLMGVVNDYNIDYPIEFYRFMKGLGTQFIQFAPIVERIDGEMAPWNVPSGKWGDFLIAIFDEWVKEDVGKIYIQLFDAALANWFGVQPGICTMADKCGHAGVLEHNGDLYSCDHFVFPEYKLGNIRSQTLVEMMYSDRQKTFGINKRDGLPSQCLNCEFLFACNGECPKNRILTTANGEPNLNYLCEGNYKFFKHIAPYMDYMKNELKNERPPANIMQAIKSGMVF